MSATRKIDLMHREFGKYDSHTCRECSNLVEGQCHDKTLRKCKVYGLTHSEASDWAQRWVACGMFCREYRGRQIIELVRRGKEKIPVQEEPLAGQVSLWEEAIR